MAYLVASIAGVAFFVMSVLLLGVWPGRVLEQQSRAMAPERPLALSASELRGRQVYSREGCAYCHTQQVRYLHADMTRFGTPTQAWETHGDYPHLWGTRRIGPDLAREGSTRSSDWQFAHLYAPRAIVPESVMPSYAALFDGSPLRPRQDARDLVAYLDSLGRARELAGPEGNARAQAACDCAGDEMTQMAFAWPPNAHPGRARARGNVPAMPATADLARGRALYVRLCVGCHGATGQGDGPGAAALSPAPSSLAAHEYAQSRIADALWNGVAGTAMPAWREYSLDDLAAVRDAVRAMAQVRNEPPASTEGLALGQRVFAANCTQCHGDDGGGNGSAAGELAVAPADLRAQRASLEVTARVVRTGIPGTKMAPWTGRLRDEEITAVAQFVRGLYRGDRTSAEGGR
jgi:cytochrome c oxidase cbb3-type subunit 2/cytochrome c oxidase cbb3-type subunit I/II